MTFPDRATACAAFARFVRAYYDGDCSGLKCIIRRRGECYEAAIHSRPTGHFLTYL